MSKKIVHVIGTGTIGEPLIGLLCDFKKQLGIDQVTFEQFKEFLDSLTDERKTWSLDLQALKDDRDFYEVMSERSHAIVGVHENK